MSIRETTKTIRLRANQAAGAFPRWTLKNPYLIIAFYFAVFVLGILAIGGALPRRFAPYVQSPTVGVVTMMPGLSAEEMELYVSKPIEEQLVNVKDLHYVRSTSQEGFSLVTIEFNYGVDMTKALFDVQALMNVIQANLPGTGANLKPSWVVPIDPLNIPIVSLSLTGDPEKGWTPQRVREFADNEAINRLKRISQVYSVVPFGGYRRQLQVIVDRDRLAAYGLSILEVKSAIDRFNVSRPGGTVTWGGEEATVRVNTRAVRAEDLLDYPLLSVQSGNPPESNAAANPDSGMGGGGMGGGMGGGAKSGGTRASSTPSGTQSTVTERDTRRRAPRVVFLRDVARVVDTHWERRSGYRYLQHAPGTAGSVTSAIEVSVIQDPGASSAQVVPKVLESVRRMEADFPGLRFEVAYDNARFTDVLFGNIWKELGVAILLAGVVLLLFLGDWRTALVALISLPASLLLAILFMVPFGMSFNSGTLIGLLISIGRLVDDSIVNVHAVERHIRMGKDVRTATIDGIGEIRISVLAGTFTTFVGLAPLLFAGGIVELMFRELVWPVIFCQLSSMFVGFTLTTLLCARLLRTDEAREAESKRPIGRIVSLLQAPLERLEARYERVVRWTLRRRAIVGAMVLTVVTGGMTFYYFLGSEMMPLADVSQASAVLEMQPGTSFAETERAVHRIEKILLKHPEIEKASIEIGAETMFESWSPYFTGYQMPQANGAAMMLTLSDKDTGRRTIWQVMDAVVAEAQATIPGIRRFQIKEMGSDVMATAAAPIHLIAYGPDLKTLDLIGREMEALARKTPGVHQAASTWTLGLPTYEVKVDPVRAQALGLSPESISQQAYYSLRGGLTDEFYRLPNLRQNTIQVRYEEKDRRDSGDIERLYVTAADGRQVPLKSVAQIERRSGPSVIEHDGLRRVVGLTAYYRIGDKPSMDVTMNLVSNAYGGNEKLGIKPIVFPPGYGLEMRGDMTQMMDSFRRLFIGLGLSLIFMYLILVAQFRGFLQPMQMLASLPDQMAGIFFLLWLTGQSFSSVSIMAVIVVAGMDITTAILILDLIGQYRDQGVERNEAVAIACRERLRPILMSTTITMVSILPAAFFPSTGQDAYRSLAIVTIGGLLTGTVLSLFDIPLMHTLTDDFIRWYHRIFLNREWQWPKADAEVPTQGDEFPVAIEPAVPH